MYLTREQATAKLVESGATEQEAAVTLGSALHLYPQSHRTNYLLITGYRQGTIMDAYYPGNPGIPADLFTVDRW